MSNLADDVDVAREGVASGLLEVDARSEDAVPPCPDIDRAAPDVDSAAEDFLHRVEMSIARIEMSMARIETSIAGSWR